MFYDSVDAMDSVKLPSVIFGQLQDGDIQDGGIQIGVLFFLAPMQHVVAQLHSITIFEDNKDTFRFTIIGSHFESIVPVVGGFQRLRMCYYR